MSKRVKKEILPFIVAIIMLFLLVGALVYTILYKPKGKDTKINENTLTAEDVLVDNKNTTCGSYDITKLSEDAKQVKLSYEIVDDYNFGPSIVIDAGEGEDMENSYGYALKIKASGLSDKYYLRIDNKTTKQTNDYYKNDIDSRGYVYFDTYNIDLQLLDVKVLINDDECKNIVLREFEITLPRMNPLIIGGLCETDEYKDREVCSPYVFDNESESTKVDKLMTEKEKVEKEKKNKEQAKEKTEKNKKWLRIIIVACVLIVITVAGVIVMKGSKKHEKK